MNILINLLSIKSWKITLQCIIWKFYHIKAVNITLAFGALQRSLIVVYLKKKKKKKKKKYVIIS